MGQNNMKAVLFGFAAAVALATGAHATTAVFDFQSPAGVDVTPTADYTVNGLKIEAKGFSSGLASDLWDKNGGGLENGLGLAEDSEHEITPDDIVQIDVTNIAGYNTAADTFSFEMGSVTDNEKWNVYGSNTSGTLGTLLYSLGSDQGVDHPLTGGFKFYQFTTPGTCAPEADCTFGNVLLHDFSATTTAVPEPATWAMMLIGIGGLGASLRASRKSAGAAMLA
jgi:hypothetical protein